MTTPLQTDGEIQGMSTGSSQRQCGCDLCIIWSPLWSRIIPKLDESDRQLFEQHLMNVANDSDSLGSAEAKLAGEWPGWEWMKEAVNQKRYHVT